MKRFFPLIALAVLAASCVAQDFQAMAEAAPNSPPQLPGDQGIQVFFQTGENITGWSAFVTAFTAGRQTGFDAVVDENQSVNLFLDKGGWTLFAVIDSPDTPGNDFIGLKPVTAGSQDFAVVVLRQAASVSGKVVDSQGNRVSNALLKTECVNDFNFSVNQPATDGNGAFLLRFLPAGKCVLTASKENAVGSASLDIARGDFKDVEIRLAEQVTPPPFPWLWLAPLFLLAAFVVHALFLKSGATSKASQAAGKGDAKESLGKKVSALPGGRRGFSQGQENALAALTEREKSVAETVFSKGGRTTQAKLSRELLLPKASLSRTISSLETRGFVEKTSLGNTRSIAFTKWFKNL